MVKMRLWAMVVSLLLLGIATACTEEAAFRFTVPDSVAGNAQLPPLEEKDDPLPVASMDALLNQIVEEYEQSDRSEAAAARAASKAPFSTGTLVGVAFFVRDTQQTQALAQFLRDNGGERLSVSEDYMEADVPVTLLVAASEQPGVYRMRALTPPRPLQGGGGN